MILCQGVRSVFWCCFTLLAFFSIAKLTWTVFCSYCSYCRILSRYTWLIIPDHILKLESLCLFFFSFITHTFKELPAKTCKTTVKPPWVFANFLLCHNAYRIIIWHLYASWCAKNDYLLSWLVLSDCFVTFCRWILVSWKMSLFFCVYLCNRAVLVYQEYILKQVYRYKP